jgi:hypothetical protein
VATVRREEEAVQANAARLDGERAAARDRGTPRERERDVVVDRAAVGARQMRVDAHTRQALRTRVDRESQVKRGGAPGRDRAGHRERWLAPRGGELAAARRRAVLRRGQGQDHEQRQRRGGEAGDARSERRS